MARAKRSILTSSHRDIGPPFADETQRDFDSLIAARCDLLVEHRPLSPPFLPHLSFMRLCPALSQPGTQTSNK
jgi:hypothetical protein